MRRCVLAAAAGVLLCVLAGCPAELPRWETSSSEDGQPVSPSPEDEQPPAPAPPPPPPDPGPPPSPEQLARQALEAPSSDEQEVAAVQLAQLGRPAREHLQRVLSQSQSPQVRAACIRGLAVQWDYDSMPAMLDALDDESQWVRGRAVEAVERMMSRNFNYQSDDPADKRAAAAFRIREHWEEFRDSEILDNWKKRLQEREQRQQRQQLENGP